MWLKYDVCLNDFLFHDSGIKFIKTFIIYFLLFNIFTHKSTYFPGNSDQSSTSKSGLAPMLPASRLLVEAFGLMTRQIPATGPKGHLLKGDVLKFIEENKVPRLNLQAAKQESSSINKKPMQPDVKKVAKAPEGL